MRSLILAGGGMKVGYQAGAMQVLLDEAGLTFDHVDATSGGCFNLAMMQSGLSGTKIADNWRKTSPFDAIWPQRLYRYLIPWAMHSLVTYSRFRSHLLPKWGVDFDRIRESNIQGTYNVFNFSDKRPEIWTKDDLDPDRFFACVALPMFFPEVTTRGKIYIDGVYYKDSNVTEAIRRGADEIWVIWTVNETPVYRHNFYRQYFHIIEAIADARFYEEVADVARINDAVSSGQDTRHRKIKLHIIRRNTPVPMDYLIYFRAKQMSRIVDMGIEDARRYLAESGLSSPEPATDRSPIAPVSLEFGEVMYGHWFPDVQDPAEGERLGQEKHAKLDVRLTITADDVSRFIDEPAHLATAAGSVDCPALGGHCQIEGGTFNLFVEDAAANMRRMLYRLPFRTPDGQLYVLAGEKDVHDDPGLDLWSDTTTLFTRIYRQGDEAKPAGAGVLHLHLQDLAHQLTTFRVRGARDRVAQAETIGRFGAFFFGALWATYVRHLLDKIRT